MTSDYPQAWTIAGYMLRIVIFCALLVAPAFALSPWWLMDLPWMIPAVVIPVSKAISTVADMDEAIEDSPYPYSYSQSVIYNYQLEPDDLDNPGREGRE